VSRATVRHARPAPAEPGCLGSLGRRPCHDSLPGIARRLAILPDNQRLLEGRLASLQAALADLMGSRVCAAMVIGSVAEGRAHDRSDIDLLLVLDEGGPRRRDYAWWDREVAARLEGDRFPVEPLFVARSALRTREPHLAGAIRRGLRSGILGGCSMTNPTLARDYPRRAEKRLKAIALLLEEEAFADVVPESQEVVELLLKAVLRTFGVAVPFTHDVSQVLADNAERFPEGVRGLLPRWSELSKQLRRDRELSFHGSEDVTASEFYEAADAGKALAMARDVHASAAPWIA
jgi:HEPN domain-containing protein